MSYTNETTHYGIPKPLGTDLTVPMDYNEAADAIDQALFDASTNATEAVTAANNAVEAAAEAVEDVGDLGTEVNSLKGRTSALEATEIIQNNKIDALEMEGVTKFDSVGIADAYVNGLTYSVGDVVTYNGQRYKCTTAVVAAEPFDADKWTAEDVETVLNDIKSDLAPIEARLADKSRIGAISNLTAGVYFTVPSDGYLRIAGRGVINFKSSATPDSPTPLVVNRIGTDGAVERLAVFVRKGMNVTWNDESTGGAGSCAFFPLLD